MVLRTASRGEYIGQQFWGCSTFPKCRSRVGIAIDAERPAADAEPPAPAAGASAQAEFERRARQRAERVRARWPLLAGLALVLMLLVYLLVSTYLDPRWGVLGAAGVAISLFVTYLERPQTIEAWRIGAAGERATARHLNGLAENGFVVLHDRKVPGYGGNLDHIVIGPTGIWAVETKNIGGKVVIDGDSLRIGGRRQDRIVDQAYREATAIQVALAAQVPGLAVAVTPIICLHRGELPFFNKRVRGVRLASGRQLVRLIRSAEERLSPDEVQRLADVAARLFKGAAS